MPAPTIRYLVLLGKAMETSLYALSLLEMHAGQPHRDGFAVCDRGGKWFVIIWTKSRPNYEARQPHERICPGS